MLILRRCRDVNTSKKRVDQRKTSVVGVPVRGKKQSSFFVADHVFFSLFSSSVRKDVRPLRTDQKLRTQSPARPRPPQQGGVKKKNAHFPSASPPVETALMYSSTLDRRRQLRALLHLLLLLLFGNVIDEENGCQL